MSDTPPATTPAPTKSVLLSKTVWLQIITLLLTAIYPPAQAWVEANPVEAVAVIAALNVIVRFVTKGKVSIFPPEDVESKGRVSGMLPLFAIGMTAGFMGVSLPSCSADYPITGTISYRDPHSGAKAGLSYSPRRKLRGGITVPIYDAQTGKQLGVTDLVIGDK